MGRDLLDHGGIKTPFIAILDIGGTVMRDIRLANQFLAPASALSLATGTALSAGFGAGMPATRRSHAFLASGVTASRPAIPIPTVTSPTDTHARQTARTVVHTRIFHVLAPGGLQQIAGVRTILTSSAGSPVR